MKQKDIAMIIVVAFFAGVFSLVVSKFFFTPDAVRNLSAEVVEPISPEFKQPDPRVFNKDAINPTKLIEIGDNKNKQPF